MRNLHKLVSVSAATCALLVGAAVLSTPVGAQTPGTNVPPINGFVPFLSPFDHMKCYKVLDKIRGAYRVDLFAREAHTFLPELGITLPKGCKVILPARLFCIDVRKNAVPVPPLSVPPVPIPPGLGTDPGDRLCYKLICPKGTTQVLHVVDQFGRRPVVLPNKSTQYLCTPAWKVESPSGAFLDPLD